MIRWLLNRRKITNAKSAKGRSRRARFLQLELLETRQMLATLLSGSRVTYQDIDGDHVTVTFSNSFLTAANVNSVFTFNTGSVNGNNSTPQRLNSINLSGIPTAAGTNITTNAVRNAATGGDGFATLGQINAPGRDLGNVTLNGDLGRIVAGDANASTRGLGALKVHSMGRFGIATGAINLSSSVTGAMASLDVATDLKTYVEVLGGANGKLGSVTIGGSMIGGASSNSAHIKTEGDLGTVRVMCDIVGTAGNSTGRITTNGKLARVTIDGSLYGGFGSESGFIVSWRDMGPVKINGDVSGGMGIGSGTVRSFGKLASATIGGSLLGGGGSSSGTIVSTEDMGTLRVGVNIKGGDGTDSGKVVASQKLTSIQVGGTLIGGTGVRSGSVESLRDAGTITIGGNVNGASGTSSGRIESFGKLTRVTIGGSLVGSTGSGSGSIYVDGELTTATINGNLSGGNASGSANLEFSGSILAGRIGTMTLTGSLIAGTHTTTGTFSRNGAILAMQDIGNLTIRGSIVGNPMNQALVTANGRIASSGTTDLAIGRLTVNGRLEFARIMAGVNIALAAANADAQIGPVVVGRDWISSDLVAGAVPGLGDMFGDGNDAKMTGVGVKDVTNVLSRIMSIVIGGQVIGTAAVGDHFGFVAENIGSLRIGGTLIPLNAGNGNDNRLLDAIFGDVRLREI